MNGQGAAESSARKRAVASTVMRHVRSNTLVRAAGVEPARALRPYGFSYHFGFRRRRKAFVVWTIPSPWPESCRRRPSSLYTFPGRPSPGLARDTHLTGFPEFERFYVWGFPRRTRSRSPSPLRLPIPPRPRDGSACHSRARCVHRDWRVRARARLGVRGTIHAQI